MGPEVTQQRRVKVEDICRQYGIAKSSYYKLRSKYRGGQRNY
ncbi:transposase [Piscirickettsia salmonis]|nr:transposase [Piscirickettsia salmonis]QHS34292.1 transposase [Piscirickettsia salmonis]